MRLRKPCIHDRYDDHFVYETDEPCPGGEFLPEGALVIEKVDGEWPKWAVEGLSDPPLYELSPKALALLEAGSHLSMPTKPRYILDALASQVGESEPVTNSKNVRADQVGESE